MLSYFLSCCIVLEETGVVTADEADTLVAQAVLSKAGSDYLRRMRGGAERLSTVVIEGLIEEGWTLGQTTSIASCT